ncbi:MAG: lytic transglycosylase domain-containing protein [Selenomonadaceae bacterium]|nr:lytic transglycosylase domain-containing protein [Selenomonadaceae bacterium]
MKINFFKRIVIAVSLSFALMIGGVEAEAVDYYSAIYQTVNRYNGNQVECDWITRAILYASSEYQVDPILITAIMEAESNFDFHCVSPVGAIGLMQLMPETARAIGVNPHNPLENVIGGTIYIKNQLGHFQNWGEYSVTDAVAAYNAGPGAVEKHGGVPNYAETVQYVINVARNYKNLLSLIQS